jgi:cytochrome c
VASERDFGYSDALKALPARGDGRWTKAMLDAFLAAPENFAPGTAMTFVELPDPKERTTVIGYLAKTRTGTGED